MNSKEIPSLETLFNSLVTELPLRVLLLLFDVVSIFTCATSVIIRSSTDSIVFSELINVEKRQGPQQATLNNLDGSTVLYLRSSKLDIFSCVHRARYPSTNDDRDLSFLRAIGTSGHKRMSGFSNQVLRGGSIWRWWR